MLTAYGNPLVAGMTPNTNMATKKMRVLRPFYIGTAVQKINAVVDVGAQLAAELFSANKAEYVKEVAKEPVREMPKERP